MSLSSLNDMLETVFRWTWQTSLYASVLIAFVWAVQWAIGKVLSPRWRYALGLLILLRLVMPGVPAARFSVFNLSKLFPGASVPVEAQTVPPTQPLRPAEISRTEGRWTTELLPVSARRFDRFSVARLTWAGGWIGILVVVVRQHRRFSARVKAGTMVGERRLFDLLGSCKHLMAVRRSIQIVSVPQLAAPALFGWRKPLLLVPQEVLEKLSEEELRMIFLHELAHLKRHDILLNWLIVFVRALHWLNPLVWLALRQLRVDREMVCDAMVLERLQASERRVYGHTLVKLLDNSSGAGFCPSLVPVVNNKSEIKRRVIMIAKFKSPGRTAVLASVAVIVALCGFTFTRAAVKAGNTQKEEGATPERKSSARANPRTEGGPTHIQYLKEKLEELDLRVSQTQDQVDEWRKKLRVPSPIAPGKSEGGFTDETVSRLESERISLESNYKGAAELLNKLKELQKKGGNELKKSILNANPDAQLAKLFEDLWTTEGRVAQLRQTLGPENVELRSLAAMQNDLTAKVNERIEGILSGLEVRAAATKAQRDTLIELIQEVRIRDADAASKYRPYLQAKRDLESLQKVRDALYVKILEQEYGVEVPSGENSKK